MLNNSSFSSLGFNTYIEFLEGVRCLAIDYKGPDPSAECPNVFDTSSFSSSLT